mmetsp:Transcript_72157/g.168893  ORF Transcript_72157/g.168893 Transcript_72157/m.168893 type:complete len:276 (-) Transcript_72157:115-942(-)
MKSIGRLLMSPFGGTTEAKPPTSPKPESGRPKLTRANSAPSLEDRQAEKVKKHLPKWLEYVAHQEEENRKAMEDWQHQLHDRLLKIRGKSALNSALNSLVLHLKKEGLTEGELFAKIDADGDGELSRQELQMALRRLGVDLTTTELDGILRIFDADGNGTVDFSEFYHLLKTQEALLPEDEEAEFLKRDKKKDFEMGDRVKVNLLMSNRALMFDEHAEAKDLHGKIVGPGKKGTIMIQLEEADRTLFVKPRQLSRTKGRAESAMMQRSRTTAFHD